MATTLQRAANVVREIRNNEQTQFVEVLYRCEGCGKWSHAKRRPREHERFLPRRSDGPDGLRVLRDELGILPGQPGFGEGTGVWVACGPFARWNATRVEYR